MTKEQKYDFIVVGAGIVGTSIAIQIKRSFQSSSVLLLEQEQTYGLHASGRNSGVLHAGFYYSPDSLKARFCREGNDLLRKIIKDNDIPILEIGKVVVASREGDADTIRDLANRAERNGVDVEVVDSKHLHKFEPLAHSKEVFLWSPRSAVSDPLAILRCLLEEANKLGVRIKFGSSIKEQWNEVEIDGSVVSCNHLINAAGANALQLAKSRGFGRQFAQLPFMGLYYGTSRQNLPVTTLVYPTPHPINPFLGVHITRTVDGRVKIGPTAIPILTKNSYNLLALPGFLELFDSLKALMALVRGERTSVYEIVKNEFPYLFRGNIEKSASLLVPSVSSVAAWKKMRPGIRAQLVDLEKKELVQDFVIEGDRHSTHVLNVVSPGWTSAIPFSKHVVDNFLNGKM